MLSTAKHTGQGLIPIGQRNGLSLAISPRQRKSVGSVIVAPNSKDLIGGVYITTLDIFADDRGYFMELVRLGSEGIAEKMLVSKDARIQISATLSYPATIKAIHYHFEQTDLWFPLSGMFQIALCDFREDSRTFGVVNTLYVGDHRHWAVLIPPGVGHGYKVLGTDPARLVYITDRFYNPQDEGRLAYDDPAIGYDWETQLK